MREVPALLDSAMVSALFGPAMVSTVLNLAMVVEMDASTVVADR